MGDPESTAVAVVADAAGSLPAPLKASFFKAVGALLGGLTAIPAAWVKRPAQSIEDTTSARSAVAAIMAKAVAEEAIRDPATMQAAAEIYLPTAVRKARNRVLVAQSAAEQINEAAANSGEPAPPDDDWMNSFMRFAEDASSERLQQLFGRILAGEVVTPGSFATATLRAVSELDQSIATDFSEAWASSVGESVDYGPEWQRGDVFARWKRLSEAGLMAPTEIAQFLPPFNPVFDGKAAWMPMQASGVSLFILFQQESTSKWENIQFTRVGREIGSLLARPDYEANMRRVAGRLPKHGLTMIQLHVDGKLPEVVWSAA